MENDKKKIEDISIIISKDFKIGESDSLIPAADFQTLENFKIYLTKKLAVLLDTQYDTLLNILYRIDVNEEKLNELFGKGTGKFIPSVLAELIIERSIQKVKFRQKYKNGEL